MAKVLYKRQKQIFDFINGNISKYGYAPTLTEIAENFGLSSLSTVHEHLAVLEKKGLIRRYKGAVRGIEILDDGVIDHPNLIELPIMGFIACGEPIEPYNDPGATLPVNSGLVRAGDHSYILQAKGDSMVDDGILNGDYLVIKEVREARDGDIIVAVLKNGFATLKRYYKELNRIRLQPANSTMSPMYVTDIEIRGKVVAVIRQFS
ncbi:repressor LexA [Candidatus Shapirobacteria bacterium RIFOXYD1_FULL_38_32]|uniref:LexA repressor n=1 Tax=Candidatus Shapirobacteria bacterium RIFOXYB1_FULL_38_38 TaxID=1802151 RepID=A0A1F7SRI2_9BACT|nr:MAG: repressor LexA [Candidatus Shapirobacteria bacterium RIFOXYB1_FULL_38_38]OGL56899.1 MAG: repressor LexA [Candidatus Shapirobacteria bacterium RIFOXYC1_FULL_38_24]OGL57619.1 MAG: repressor LexA [Candidatus Shapirobacteria bacterium RIFOXYD1_FULL_38_32]HCU55355.1 repressor LexA [Candidatus Shapirobacteria bacterium]